MSGARHRYRRSGTSLRGVATLAAVPLAAGALTCGWLFLRVTAGAAGCSGSVTLTVSVAPALAEPLQAAAVAYRSEHPAVFGYCASLEVNTVDGGKAASYLRGGWNEPGAGEIPDVWVPDSADWLALARTTEPANRLLIDSGTVIATSPVVLAMPRPMAEALGWPRNQVSWVELQEFLGAEDFWGARGQEAWGDFSVGLPDPRTSTAGLTALTNAVSLALDVPPEQLTERVVTSDMTARRAVLELERRAGLVPDSDAGLLTALRAADVDSPEAPRMSVALLSESVVYQYNRGLGTGGAPVAADGAPVAADGAPAAADGAPAAADGAPAAADGGAGGGMPGGEQLVASYPDDGQTLDEIRYIELSRASADPVKARMARDLLAVVQSPRGRSALAHSGFRPPDGVADSFGPEIGLLARPHLEKKHPLTASVLAALQATFISVHQRANVLAVLDTSGSMNEPVPGGPGRSRLTVAIDAAKAALPLFADDSRLGLWRFSVRLRGEQDWAELVPLGPINEQLGPSTRAQALVDAMDAIEARGDTGLYDTALAAFRYMTGHYLDGRPNQVVLVTDGRNSDPGSLSLDELVRTLREEYSPRRPVEIVTIGYGTEADLGALARISEATGAETYPALDPNNIFGVLVGALTEIPH
ncbi:substrate-binding domain-containing protein [Parafrankia sp. FMc2]|uniref:substrate-binding domain-containing protein n=1 Tax=Parafrankia sp. FMc2 TaxID=3233196 RepID=UPI0034D41632